MKSSMNILLMKLHQKTVKEIILKKIKKIVKKIILAEANWFLMTGY